MRFLFGRKYLVLTGFLIGCGTESKSTETATPRSQLEGSSLDLLNGTKDLSNKYPSVVAVESAVSGGEACTATRVGPRHFFTAAHCQLPSAKKVYLNAEIDSKTNQDVYRLDENTSKIDPLYTSYKIPKVGETPLIVGNDFSLITVSEKLIKDNTYSTINISKNIAVSLINEGAAAKLKKKDIVDLVGYGCSNNTKKLIEKLPASDFIKRFGSASITALTNNHFSLGEGLYIPVLGAFINLNPSQAQGCRGDSGGPAFYQNQLVGVISRSTLNTDIAKVTAAKHAWVKNLINTPIVDRYTDKVSATYSEDPKAPTTKIPVGQDLILIGYKLVGSSLYLPGVPAPIAISASNLVSINDSKTEVVKIKVPSGAVSGDFYVVNNKIKSNVLPLKIAPAFSLDDFAYQQSDSAALSDLNSTAGDLATVEVEGGKSLYLFGNGLKGASFTIPGSSVQLTGTAIVIPASDPLFISGKDVVKIQIPSNATGGSSGVIQATVSAPAAARASSTRQIRIAGDVDWGYYAKIFTLPENSSVTLGDSQYKCENDRVGRYFTGGFLVGIVKVVKGKPDEIVPGISWCLVYDIATGQNFTVSSTSGSGIGSTVSHTTTNTVLDQGVNPPQTTVQIQTWYETAYVKQERLPDGTCKRTTHLERCTTQSYTGNPDYTTCPASNYVAKNPGAFDVSGGLKETVQTGACVDEKNSSGQVLNDAFLNAQYWGEATRTAVVRVN